MNSRDRSSRLKWMSGIGTLMAVTLVVVWSGAGVLSQEVGGPDSSATMSSPKRLAATLLPGTLRRWLAACLWIQAYESWDRRDPRRTVDRIRRASMLDPENVHYWLNGARIMAFDLPRWRIEALEAAEGIPTSLKRRIQDDGSSMALEHLKAGLERNGAQASLYLEMGYLHWTGRRDYLAAFESFALATQQRHAPLIASRLAVECLRRLDRSAEALEGRPSVSQSGPKPERREGKNGEDHLLSHRLEMAGPGGEFHRQAIRDQINRVQEELKISDK